MKKTLKGALAFLALIVALVSVTVISSFAASTDAKWITAWGTAPTEVGIDGYDNIAAYVSKVTVRSVISPTASGSKLRIRISNVYGDEAMKLTRVTVAKSTGGSNIDLSTLKAVTFNDGQPFVSVPAGKEYLSDPVTMEVNAGEKIAISIFVEDFTEVKTMGLSGGDTYIATSLEGDGDFTDQASMNLGSILDDEDIMQYLSMFIGDDVSIKLAASFIKVVPCLASVEVLADENAYSVVVVGDSTVSNEFPEYLGDAINEKNIKNVGVVGKGIIGNRLLGDGLGYGSLLFGESLLDRFNRDVLSQSGVKYVVVKIGANDIIHPVCSDIKQQYPNIKQPTSAEIIEGYKKIFKMCHDAGVKVIVMSITPWKGATRDYFGTGAKYVRTTAEFEADWKIATEVNSWLAGTNLHDGFVNVNSYSVNPLDTQAFMPEYTIDGIHPSDTMQRIWGEKFPLSLVGVGKTVGGVRVSKTAANVFIGDKFTLTADVYPETATNKAVKWGSSDTSVIKVSDNGVVQAVGHGAAFVICKTVDGGYTASCKVKVFAKPESVTLNKTTATMYTTRSVQLSATVLPAVAYNKNVIWSSSNTAVATVDKNGKVTGVGAGKAVITAKTEVGGYVATCVANVVPKVSVTEITLNKTSGALYKGASLQLRATISPSNATFTNVKWSSSNTKVATVSDTGLVKAVGAGTAVIYCRSVENPRAVAAYNLTVAIKTTGVKLNRAGVSVYQGYSTQLTATVSPSNATNKKVTWSSSNTKVATVDKNGKVTGVNPGEAYIYCKTANGGYVAKCLIAVKKLVKVTAVTLNKTGGSMYHGNTYQLKATVSPSNATNKNVTWTSSDPKVVSVSSTGLVKALKPGKAVITCKTNQGGKIAKCSVTVVPVSVSSVSLSKTSVVVAYNTPYKLVATVSPANATNKAVKWTSSNPKEVPVSANGYVNGVKANATAVITCTTVDGKKVATCKVKVAPVSVTGVKISKTAATVAIGKSLNLFAAVSPSNATNKAVVWSSSNSKVASVDQNGLVKGKAAGSATIYCKTKDGGFVAACKVTVKGVKVLGVMLDIPSYAGKVGSSFTLKATVIPTNATNQKVVWSSNDTSVATVNSQGKVVCVGKGSCQISAATVEGNFIEVCKVTVS